MTQAGDRGLQVAGGRQISKQAMLAQCDEHHDWGRTVCSDWETGKSLAELED